MIKNLLRKKHGLQTKLVIIMTAIIASISILLIFVSTLFMFNSSIGLIRESAGTTLKSTSMFVERTLFVMVSNTQTIASNEAVQDTSVSKEEKLAVLENIRQQNGFDEVGFVDLNGQGYSNFGDFDFNDQLHFQTASKGQVFVGEPIVNRLNGQVIIITGAPVYKDSKLVGTVYIVDMASRINDKISELSFGKTGHAYIVNSQGTMIYNKDTQKVVDAFNPITQAQSNDTYRSYSDAMKQIISGGAGTVEYTYNGVNMFSAYQPIDGYDSWYVVMEAPKIEFTQAVWFSVAISIITLVVLLIFSICLITANVKKMVGPIGSVTGRLKLLSEGDVSSPVEIINTDDEIGMLSSSLNSTVETLQSYVGDIDYVLREAAQGNLTVESGITYTGDFITLGKSMDQIITTLNSMLGQIRNASEQVASGSEQVASGAQALSQGTTEQASSIEELAATINMISEKIRGNAENSLQASQKASKVGTEMRESNRQMKEMITAMSDINSRSEEIGKIIKTIEDIAFQTNILALNAAVEAARAGTAGKGFAVVADEVRNLASKSAEASKNTSDLIENSIRSIENGTKIADITAKSMLKAVDGASEVVAIIDQISEASSGQADSIQQVTVGIDQVSAVVQTNSATSEQSAAASEELSSQATDLKSIVDRFRLRQ